MKTLKSVSATAPKYYSLTLPVQSITMTVPEWLDVPENPIQRNDELRVNMRHLRKLHLAHRCVSMAALPDGSIYKLDGHTRARKWAEGTLAEPDYLQVAVFSVRTIAEVEDLYRTFDARTAIKTSADEVCGGIRRADLSFETPWLQAGKFAAMLALAHDLYGVEKKAPHERRVNLWAEELKLFDSISPKKGRFIIGVGAAALCALRKHGDSAIDFFDRYNRDIGMKTEDRRDSAQMLSDYIADQRRLKRLAGIKANTDHCAITLSLAKRHFSGELFRNMPRPVDLRTFFKV